MKVNLIVAVSENNVIGKNGLIPWNSKEDMKFFKEKTLNHIVIMGRKTYESLRIKPLPNRFNIVLTRNPDLEGVQNTEGYFGPLFLSSLEDALSYSQEKGVDDVFVIGGEQVYKEALDLDLVDRIYMNVIKGNYDGDAIFPYFDRSKWFVKQSETLYTDFISYIFEKPR